MRARLLGIGGRRELLDERTCCRFIGRRFELRPQRSRRSRSASNAAICGAKHRLCRRCRTRQASGRDVAASTTFHARRADPALDPARELRREIGRPFAVLRGLRLRHLVGERGEPHHARVIEHRHDVVLAACCVIAHRRRQHLGFVRLEERNDVVNDRLGLVEPALLHEQRREPGIQFVGNSAPNRAPHARAR